MTPAEELRQAVAELRSVPVGDDVPVAGGTIPARIAEPLAAWLEIAHDYVAKSHPDLALASPFRRGGVDLARAILRDDSEQSAAPHRHPITTHAYQGSGFSAPCEARGYGSMCGDTQYDHVEER